MTKTLLSTSLILVLILVTQPWLSESREIHVIKFKSSGLYPEGLTYDPTSQHFIVASLKHNTFHSVSDAGVIKTLTLSTTSYGRTIPLNSTILGIAVDHRRNRLFAAVNMPVTSEGCGGPFLATFCLQRDSLSLLYYTPLATYNLISAVANAVTVDTYGTVYVTNSGENYIWKVTVDGKSSILSNSAIFHRNQVDRSSQHSYRGLNGIVYVPGTEYLLVVQSNTGLMFKVDIVDGTARPVILSSKLTLPDGITVRKDGIVIVVSMNDTWMIKGDDSWSEGVIINKTALDRKGFPTSVCIGGGGRIYVVYGHVEDEIEDETRKETVLKKRERFRIEDIWGKSEKDGKWWHAGYHLTTAIAGPTILTLPYVFRGLGWGLGFLCLTTMGLVTFYAYYLMSLVLDFFEQQGRRHIRFRELAADVLGFGWMYYFVMTIQNAINTGVGIGTILLAGQSIQLIYASLLPKGTLQLYHFIAMVTVVMIILAQIPTFHALRHINLGSLILALGYSFVIVGACIHAGRSKYAPKRDYSLAPSEAARVFNAFTSISLIAAIFGNGILPEIQATLAAPATGKMLKALSLCYAVIFVTCFAVTISGYYVFGNKSTPIIINSFFSNTGPALIPGWVLILAVTFVLLQLFAIALVYSQVAFEVMEKKSADAKQGMFSKRNLIPRLILRTVYMILCGFFAAMLPFFADISSVVGAIGFIPLDFILPMLLYNMTYKPSKSSWIYWVNVSIIVVFTGAGLLGAFASIRKLVLDANTFKLFSS